MSDVENPYKAPETEITPLASESGFALTEPMKLLLTESHRWIEFIAVITFVGVGIIALLGVGVLISGSFGMFTDFGGGGIGAAFGLVYIALAAVMFFPARYLWLHGKNMKLFGTSGLDTDFENSLRNAKSMWKFYGIQAIVYIGIIVLGIIVSIIIGIAAAF